MAMLETRGDYDYAHNVEVLRAEVKTLNKKLDDLSEVNDNLCKVNNNLYLAVCEQNDLIRELLRRNN